MGFWVDGDGWPTISDFAKLSSSRQLKFQLNWDSIITTCLPTPELTQPDNLKNEDNHKYEDYLKYENDIKYEDNLKYEDNF